MSDRQQQYSRYMAGFLMWLSFVVITDIAYANPVSIFFFSPREIFSGITFLYANGMIGIFEGVLIGCWLKADFKPTIWVMIAANCFSGVMGYVISEQFNVIVNPLQFSTDIFDGAWATSILPLLGYFIAAVLLEWPFCFWLVRFFDRRWRRATFASLIAQGSSYTILILFFNIV